MLKIVGRVVLIGALLITNFTKNYAQAPVNDNCDGAISITVDAPSISGSATGATAGTGQPCTGDLGAPSGTANDEVWYKFTAPSAYLVIEAVGSSQYNAVLQVFSGNCGSLSLMECANEGKIGKPEKLPINYYTPGSTYYFRVYDESGDKPATPDFQVRVYTAKPPANDECANSTLMPVRDHCQSTTQNQEGATGSGVSLSCANGAANNDDVWYSFVPTSNNIVIKAHASHNYRAVMEVFDGGCGSKAIACTTTLKHNMALKLAFNDLTPGKTYNFRVLNYYTPLSKSETFELCVYDPPKPVNDECAGAIEIKSNETIAGTVDGTTPSTGAPAPCAGTPDDDLWYKFTAISSEEILQLLPSPYFDGVIQVLDGCGGQVVDCINAGARNKVETLTLTNLTPGNEYLVRVFTFENTASVTADFQISRTSGTVVALVNDDCNNAINIPLTSAPTSINGGLENATQSIVSCDGGGVANDAWYKFTTLGTSTTIQVQPADINDFAFSIFDACNGNEIKCVNETNSGEDEIAEKITLDAQMQYFMRVFDVDGNNHNTDFTINIKNEDIVQGIVNNQADILKAYPTPANEILNLEFQQPFQGHLSIIDLNGNTMLSDQGDLRTQYNISEFKPGVYTLKIVSDENIIIRKIIKQ